MGFLMANKYAAKMMKKGNIVFSPISHSHPIAIQESLPNTLEFWINQDLSFIYWCDEVHVVQLDNWMKSRGVSAEIEYAKQLNKPIKYIEI